MQRVPSTPITQNRAKYEQPRITVYGNIRDITRATANNNAALNDNGAGAIHNSA